LRATGPIYLDSSVVVSYYVPEPASGRVQLLYEPVENPAISELVDLEVIAALSLRHRIGDLELSHLQRVASLFDEHLAAGLYARVPLQADYVPRPAVVIGRFDLP
jgi:predicted nucleic acid-binding protein